MSVQCLTIVCLIGTLLYIHAHGRKAEGDETEHLSLQNQPIVQHSTGTSSANYPTETPTRQTVPASFTFDPNTADSATWVQLGLHPWQARSIMRYRAKGGQFNRTEDVKRIYGLTNGQWQHLEPLIRIDAKYQYVTHDEQYITHRPDTTTRQSAKLRQNESIDLATADTTDLQRIPGIGPVLARRLNRYIQQLGGLYSTSQLNDEGLSFLPMGIEQYVRIDHPNVHPLHINQMTVRQLNSHPYISYPQALQLARRIESAGPIRTWDEILFLPEFSEKDKVRLEPYVRFD